MDLLQRPAAITQFDCQPIQQLSMRRSLSLRAKILFAGHNAAAENLSPGAIDLHSRCERIGRIDEPFGQPQPRRRCSRWRGWQAFWHAGLDLFTGREKVAALE